MIVEGTKKTTWTKDKKSKYWKVTKVAGIRWKIVKREQVTRKDYLKNK